MIKYCGCKTGSSPVKSNGNTHVSHIYTNSQGVIFQDEQYGKGYRVHKIDLYWIYKIAFREWNELADDYNQWSELDKDEKLSLMSQVLTNDYELTSSEVTKLLTKISEKTWEDWNFASEGNFKYCEELPKTRKEMQGE